MISFRSLNLKRHAAWTGAFLIVLTAGVLVVRAQAPTPPYALFQYASLTGSGNTITATQIPVVTATGVTVYENLTLQFNSDANGNLTIASGFPQIIPAPTLITSGFKTGTYVGPSTVLNGTALVTISGPGVTDGGATEWSLSSAAGANSCTYPLSANWYVGPIANNPNAYRLKTDGITSTAWSYGVGSASQCSGANNYWINNALIGVSQVGNTITIISFSQQGVDSSTPLAQITYTLQQ
jgi:hypothetical protein